jgi:hypothetical protein
VRAKRCCNWKEVVEGFCGRKTLRARPRWRLSAEDVKVTWMVFEQRGSEIENGKDVGRGFL